MSAGNRANGDWYVYILECADRTLYTGITNNLQQRLKNHNDGTAARYTRGRGPVRIVYHEIQEDRSEASRREMQIKKLTRAEKLALIGNTASSG